MLGIHNIEFIEGLEYQRVRIKGVLDSLLLHVDHLSEDSRTRIYMLLDNTISDLQSILHGGVPANQHFPHQHAENHSVMQITSVEQEASRRTIRMTSSLTNELVLQKLCEGSGVLRSVVVFTEAVETNPKTRIFDLSRNQQLEEFLQRIRTLKPENSQTALQELYLTGRTALFLHSADSWMTTSNNSSVLSFWKSQEVVAHRYFDEFYLDRYPNYDRNVSSSTTSSSATSGRTESSSRSTQT